MHKKAWTRSNQFGRIWRCLWWTSQIVSSDCLTFASILPIPRRRRDRVEMPTAIVLQRPKHCVYIESIEPVSGLTRGRQARESGFAVGERAHLDPNTSPYLCRHSRVHSLLQHNARSILFKYNCTQEFRLVGCYPHKTAQQLYTTTDTQTQSLPFPLVFLAPL